MIDKEQRIRVFVLRGVDGAGGGADKIILRTAAQAQTVSLEMQVCFMRHRQDPDFDLDRRSHELSLDYAEVLHQGPFDRTVLKQLLRKVREFKPHLIHAHDYKANFYAAALSRRTGLPRISTSHGWTGHGFRERWLYYPADKWLLRRFDARIAVSNEIREQLLRFGADAKTTHVVLNGVDPAAYERCLDMRLEMRQELGFDDQTIVLGAVGRVEKQKRFDLLLDAFRIVHQEYPQARLVIAGEGSLLNDLRGWVQQRKLEHEVRVLGHCPDMKRLYQTFDRLVQSSDYEGTPTVVVEAMAMKIPTIATDAGGTAQLLEHEREGWIVPIGQPKALAQSVIQSLEDDQRAKSYANAARQRVETELSFSHRMSRLREIYETVARYVPQ